MTKTLVAALLLAFPMIAVPASADVVEAPSDPPFPSGVTIDFPVADAVSALMAASIACAVPILEVRDPIEEAKELAACVESTAQAAIDKICSHPALPDPCHGSPVGVTWACGLTGALNPVLPTVQWYVPGRVSISCGDLIGHWQFCTSTAPRCSSQLQV